MTLFDYITLPDLVIAAALVLFVVIGFLLVRFLPLLLGLLDGSLQAMLG